MLESVSVKSEETFEYFCNVLLLLLGTFSTSASALAMIKFMVFTTLKFYFISFIVLFYNNTSNINDFVYFTILFKYLLLLFFIFYFFSLSLCLSPSLSLSSMKQ